MRSATPKHPTAPFDTEGEAVEYLAALMESMNWRFKQEYELKNRTRVDFVLVDAEGDPVVGIEAKRRLGAETSLSEFSDYFEQCENYARKLGAPVYLAPFVSEFSPSVLASGGSSRLKASSAFMSLAGRMNVGLFAVRTRPAEQFMMMRSQIVWRSGSHYRREAWRPHNGQIASAYGSTQVRRPMA